MPRSCESNAQPDPVAPPPITQTSNGFACMLSSDSPRLCIAPSGVFAPAHLTCLTYLDPDHSAAKLRFITVGMSSASRVLMVAHTDSNENVRIISARKTTQRE